jgi:hypothetical protein
MGNRANHRAGREAARKCSGSHSSSEQRARFAMANFAYAADIDRIRAQNVDKTARKKSVLG